MEGRMERTIVGTMEGRKERGKCTVSWGMQEKRERKKEEGRKEINSLASKVIRERKIE